ncbi:MAG TPA: Uma2 family endonuclease [Thermoanaerobaculia bacterium]|nr:Uma2 family endonuclease [Thermoanaerobaculia bacterium]
MPRAHHHFTYEEYLAYERDSDRKHEYDSGEIFAMAGGSPRHSALASRISAALENARVSGCTAFQSDMRIPSLQEYVLVSQEPRVEVYRRLPSGGWEYHEATEGAVTLASGATLDLAALYAELPH